MKHPTKSKPQSRERRWVLFSNGCLHGVRHSEVVFTRSTPHRSFVRNSVAVFSISRTAGLLALLAVLVVLFIALAGCQTVEPLRGGSATTGIGRAGHTNVATLRQSDNPKEPSQQTVESQQTLEYVLPAGSAIELGTSVNDPGNRAIETSPRPGGGSFRPERQQIVVIDRAVPVRMTSRDRTETRLGAAQKDTGSEWARRAGQMQPVMWAGIAMMTLVAGVLIYFGWWTKAALAIGVGAGMVVLAQTLPEHGTAILLGGIGVFGAAALLILYAYTKGQLDKNHNGIPDFLEADRSVPY